MTDEALTEVLGAKCPACGWRRGQHRPGSQWQEPCPELGEDSTQEA